MMLIQSWVGFNRNPEAFKEIMVERTRFPKPVKDLYRVPVFPETSPPSEKDITATQDWTVMDLRYREVFRSFGGFVMPTTIFLSAEGDVAYSWAGVLTGDELRRSG